MKTTTNKTTPEAAEQPQPAVTLKIQIIKNRTIIGSLQYAAGTRINLPEDKANALVKMGAAKIIGIA